MSSVPAPRRQSAQFAHAAALGLAVLEPEELLEGCLSLELGLSLWMAQAGADVDRATASLLDVRDALLRVSALDGASEPVPLLAGDERTAILGLAIYLEGVVGRAADSLGVTRQAVGDLAVAPSALD